MQVSGIPATNGPAVLDTGSPDEFGLRTVVSGGLLIGVTRFFRDDAAFAALEGRIIPELVKRAGVDEQIRVWVPGCATGQEAYSIAMLLHEQMIRTAGAPRPCF